MEHSQPHHIHASSVTLTVIDDVTGQQYERQLPLDFIENANGILLSGEDAAGLPSCIVFLSQTYQDLLKDLIGKGANTTRCHEEKIEG